MRVTVEQIDRQCEEELIVRCYDPSAVASGGLRSQRENRSADQ